MEGSVLAAEPYPPQSSGEKRAVLRRQQPPVSPSGELLFSVRSHFTAPETPTVGANIVRPWVCYSSVKMPYASSLEEVSEGRRSHPYNRPLYKLHEKG